MERKKMNRFAVLALTVAIGAGSAASAHADAVLTDNFSTSSVNSASPAAPTATSTAYQFMSSKSYSPTPSASAGDLQFGIAPTSAGHIEGQALFTSSPVTLANAGDYVEMTLTFTDTDGGLLGATDVLGFGMYNSGGSSPVAGGLNGTAVSGQTTNVTDGVAGWKGFVSRIAYSGGNNRIATRDAQTGTGNNNQDLITEGSSSQSYRNPGPTTLKSDASTLAGLAGDVYTEDLRFMLLASGDLQIDSNLYSGTGTAGTNLMSQTGTATGATLLTTTFDGLAFGYRYAGGTTGPRPLMDVNSLTVSTNVSAPVPEPASLGVLAVAGVGLLLRRRRA